MKSTTLLVYATCVGTLAMSPVVARPADPLGQLMHKAGKSRLIVVGEMHGTREVPALVADMADR